MNFNTIKAHFKPKKQDTTYRSREPSHSNVGSARSGDATTAVNDTSSLSQERYGIFVFQDKSATDDGIIDIIAVHGLNGHYDDTWTWTSGNQGEKRNWLKDFLPQQIPNARIMSYGYNSAVQFSKSAANISNFAEQLLNDLVAERDTPAKKTRPIIFICHSLGGIVFKKASPH
jgi:hypothetical protein